MLFLILFACTTDRVTKPSGTSDHYNPPVGEGMVVDVLPQRAATADILWLVDNSPSMAEEQQLVKKNAAFYVEALQGADYHLGVVTTDMLDPLQSGKLRYDDAGIDRYISTTYDANEATNSFRQRAMAGTEGSPLEQGKDALYAALTVEANGANAGFLREDAELSIVVLADEADDSRMDVGPFVDFLQQWKGDSVSFSSVVPFADGDCGPTERGNGYLEVTDALGGVTASPCDEDWPWLMEQLAMEALSLKQEFFLSALPVVDTISVDVTGDPDWADRTWHYNQLENSIVFDAYVPAVGAMVQVEYESARPESVWE